MLHLAPEGGCRRTRRHSPHRATTSRPPRPTSDKHPLGDTENAFDTWAMNKTRRWICAALIALAELLAGCALKVRYQEPGRDLNLEVNPADKAADLIE